MTMPLSLYLYDTLVTEFRYTHPIYLAGGEKIGSNFSSASIKIVDGCYVVELVLKHWGKPFAYGFGVV